VSKPEDCSAPLVVRASVIAEIIEAVREAVGAAFPIGIKINSTDNLAGGLSREEALDVVRMLDRTSVDLIDVSGGTYFPGAPSSSDRTASSGPYFLDFAERAKSVTAVPIMLTGGFKTRDEAKMAIERGAADVVGLARAMVLNPSLPKTWLSARGGDPEFPVFDATVPGGVTAWYSMRLTAIGQDKDADFDQSLAAALEAYEARDEERCTKWRARFA